MHQTRSQRTLGSSRAIDKPASTPQGKAKAGRKIDLDTVALSKEGCPLIRESRHLATRPDSRRRAAIRRGYKKWLNAILLSGSHSVELVTFSLAIERLGTITGRIGDVEKSTYRKTVRSEVCKCSADSGTSNRDVLNQKPLSGWDLVSLAE